MRRVKSFTNKKANSKVSAKHGHVAMTSMLAMVALSGASTYVAFVTSNAAELMVPSVRFQLPTMPSLFQKEFKFERLASTKLAAPRVSSIAVEVPTHIAYVPGVEFEVTPIEPVAIHAERAVFAQLAVRFNMIIGAQALDADQIVANMNGMSATIIASLDEGQVQTDQSMPSAKPVVIDMNTQSVASSGIVKHELSTQRRLRKKHLRSITTVVASPAATEIQVALLDTNAEDGVKQQLGYSELLQTLGVSKVNTLDMLVGTQAVGGTTKLNTQLPVAASDKILPAASRDQTIQAAVVEIPQVMATQSAAPSEKETIIEGGLIVGARGPASPQQNPMPPKALSTQAMPAQVQTQATQAQVTQKQEAEQREVSTQVQQAIPFSGIVTEAFSNGARPLEGVKVQIVGSNLETYTDATGAFNFKNFQVQGVLPVMISKDLFFWRRVDLKAGVFTKIELIAENGVNAAVLALGRSRQQDTGFVFGQLYDPAGRSLAAYNVHLLGIEDRAESEAANYVTSKGVPSNELSFSDERGQFIFSNVRPGTYLMVITDVFGQDRAPHIVRVGAGEGIVRKFSIGSKVIVSGQVLNATMQNAPLDEANVQILGATKNGFSNKQGQFIIGPTYLDCDELNFLQVEKQGFYRNRLPYKCVASPDSENQFYVFSRSYIDSVSQESDISLDRTAGLVMGHLNFNRPVKAQLLGPEEMNPSSNVRGMDFYFDRDGLLNANRETTSQNGNFTILNAPAGLSYLQAYDHENNAIVITPVLVSPSTVNVSIQ